MLMHLLVHVAASPEWNAFLGQSGTTQPPFTVPTCQRQWHHQVKCFLVPVVLRTSSLCCTVPANRHATDLVEDDSAHYSGVGLDDL